MRVRWAQIVACSAVVALISAVPWVTIGRAVAAPSCPNYYFIGARGSSESPQGKSSDYSASNNWGMGTTVAKVYTKLSASLPKGTSITPYGVHYPAVSVFGSAGDDINGLGALIHIGLLGGYTSSVKRGTSDTQSFIESKHATCRSSKFIISGYSQGAQAEGDALQRMPSADRKLVVAAAFFGDPEFNADDVANDYGDFDPNHYGSLGVRGSFTGAGADYVFSYCRDYDPICDLSVKWGPVYVRDYFRIKDHADSTHQGLLAEHEKYAVKKSTTDPASEAADRIANALGIRSGTSSTAPLDLVFCIDSTGSMQPEIDAVEANVIGLANTIARSSSNYRFALVDYKDDPADDSPYQSRVDLSFTTSTSAFSSAVSSLSAFGGGDIPESVYAGVMTALGLPWRAGVRKAVVVIGDAPGKDPEPVTGNTLSTVAARALAVDPAQVYTVPVGGDSSTETFMSNLATATGGSTTVATSTDDFIAKLTTAIVKVGAAPTADIGGPYSGISGVPIAFSAAGTSDVTDHAVAYDWNFGIGTPAGSFDLTTTSPHATHVYSTPGTYNLTLRVRTADGLAGTAAGEVVVSQAPAAVPGKPSDLQALPTKSSVTLSWKSGSGGLPQYYVIRDSSGSVVQEFSTAGGDSPLWEISDLLSNHNYSYSVAAGNYLGEGAQAGPISVKTLGSAPSSSASASSPSDSSSASTGPDSPTGTSGSGSLSKVASIGDPGRLASTGKDLAPLTETAVILVLTGGIMTVAGSRRRPRPRHR